MPDSTSEILIKSCKLLNNINFDNKKFKETIKYFPMTKEIDGKNKIIDYKNWNLYEKYYRFTKDGYIKYMEYKDLINNSDFLRKDLKNVESILSNSTFEKLMELIDASERISKTNYFTLDHNPPTAYVAKRALSKKVKIIKGDDDSQNSLCLNKFLDMLKYDVIVVSASQSQTLDSKKKSREDMSFNNRLKILGLNDTDLQYFDYWKNLPSH